MRASLYICYFNTEEPLVHTQVLPYLRSVAGGGTRVHLLTYEKRRSWHKGERERRRELARKLAADGILWHTLKYHKRPSLLATAFDVLLGVIYGAWLVAHYGIKIVHARAHVPGVIGLVLKLTMGCKLIFDLRGLMAEEYVDNGVWVQGNLPFRLVKRAECVLLRQADHIIVLTEKMKTILTTDHRPPVPPPRITVIPCCVDLAHYPELEPQGEISNEVTLIYAGTTTGLYLISEMIDFFKAIKSRRKESRFIILTKSNSKELARLFKSKGLDESAYSILNAAPNEVAGILKKGTLGISFRKPGFAQVAASPTKVGEYLAAGLPIVSTPGVGDTDALVESENVGLIVSQFNPQAYEAAADQIIRSLENTDVRDRCRKVASKYYSLCEVGEPRYRAVYESLSDGLGNNNEFTPIPFGPTGKDACCPSCRSTSVRLLAVANEGIRLQKCQSCGVNFHNEFSASWELDDYYSQYYHEDNLIFSPITEARFQALLASFEPYRKSGKILDIGCGAGQFLNVAIKNGWSAYGTEIASGALEQLSRLGINSFFGELRSANYPSNFFDVVYCSEVIEHLLDPTSLLKEIARILRPGGLLYLTTPNFNSLSRRLIGYEWRVFGKEHICYFTPRTLSRALREAGFSSVRASTRNIDPGELKKLFGKRSASDGTGFQIDRTEQLREQLETKRSLRMAKQVVNTVLSATGTGDTICVRAEK